MNLQLTHKERRVLKTRERAHVWKLQLDILTAGDYDHQCDLVDQLRKVISHAMATPTLHSKKAYRELAAAYKRAAADVDQGRV